LIGRKIVFIVSLIFFLISGIVFLFSDSIINFGLGFMLFGFYRAMASGSIEAWFIDELHILNKTINLQKQIAFTNTFAALGGILGSVLCGIIPITFGNIIYSNYKLSTFSGNLIIMILVIFFLIIFVIIIISERSVNIIPKEKIKYQRIILLWKYIIDTLKYGIEKKTILFILIAMFVWGFSFSGIEFFWQPKIQNLMGSEFKIWILSIVSTAYYIFGLIGNVIITRICILFKNNYLRILFIIRLSFGITLILLAFQKSLIIFIILFLCLNLLASMHVSPHKSILNMQIDRKRRSSVLSLESLFMELGGLFGVFFVGVIADYYSIKSAWFIRGIIFLLSGFI
jgi:MFS family permease